jgi:acetyltransferase-like isoleucine patch superfamily enzyme
MTVPQEFQAGRLISLREARLWLKHCGVRVKLYAGCRLIPPDRISIGDYSQIDEGVRIYAGEGVVIGRHVHLAFNSSISGGGTCVLQDFVGIGAGVRLITGSDVPDDGGLTNPTVPDELRSVRRDRIEIGAHALVFTNAVVLPGVTIGEGAVVAAGAIVHHTLKPWGIYAGYPLVQIGQREAGPVLRKAAALAKNKAEFPQL